jgi:chemotaxis protein methyltransferase CheR
MLLREYFPTLDGWHVRLIASDLSSTALERACQGRYSQMEVGRGLPPELLAKYFEKQGDGWQIKQRIRSAVEFRTINLSGLWPALPQMDLVLLRNVLIYFDTPTKKQILAKIRSLLRPDGYLLLGGAETTHNLDDGFEQVRFERVSYSRLRSG